MTPSLKLKQRGFDLRLLGLARVPWRSSESRAFEEFRRDGTIVARRE